METNAKLTLYGSETQHFVSKTPQNFTKYVQNLPFRYNRTIDSISLDCNRIHATITFAMDSRRDLFYGDLESKYTVTNVATFIVNVVVLLRRNA